MKVLVKLIILCMFFSLKLLAFKPPEYVMGESPNNRVTSKIVGDNTELSPTGLSSVTVRGQAGSKQPPTYEVYRYEINKQGQAIASSQRLISDKVYLGESIYLNPGNYFLKYSESIKEIYIEKGENKIIDLQKVDFSKESEGSGTFSLELDLHKNVNQELVTIFEGTKYNFYDYFFGKPVLDWICDKNASAPLSIEDELRLSNTCNAVKSNQLLNLRLNWVRFIRYNGRTSVMFMVPRMQCDYYEIHCKWISLNYTTLEYIWIQKDVSIEHGFLSVFEGSYIAHLQYDNGGVSTVEVEK